MRFNDTKRDGKIKDGVYDREEQRGMHVHVPV
jgi:hypothetical protein